MRENPSNDCLEVCSSVYRAGKPYSVSVEIEGEPLEPGPGRSRVYLVVKSLRLPSIDEAWIVSGLLSSLRQRHSVRILEYEPHGSRRGGVRNREFIRALRRAVQEGSGIVALVPHLFTLDLMSVMDDRMRSLLEGNYIISVEASFRNILYLPQQPGGDSRIEIVGKRNSSASYERVMWLADQARRLGLDVREVFLNDNSEIYNYVVSGAPLSFYTRVPATKISLLGAVLASCNALEGLTVLERIERAEHTVYAIGVPRETVDALVDALLRLPRSEGLDEEVESRIAEGCRGELEHLGLLI